MFLSLSPSHLILIFSNIKITGGTTVTEAVQCPPNETRMIVSLDTSKVGWPLSKDMRCLHVPWISIFFHDLTARFIYIYIYIGSVPVCFLLLDFLSFLLSFLSPLSFFSFAIPCPFVDESHSVGGSWQHDGAPGSRYRRLPPRGQGAVLCFLFFWLRLLFIVFLLFSFLLVFPFLIFLNY